MKKYLLLFAAAAAAAIGFPLAQTQVDIHSSDAGVRGTKKFYLDGGGNTYLMEASADRIDVVAGAVTRLSLNTAGTAQPGFMAHPSTEATYGVGITTPMTMDVEDYDNGGNFASSVFTAPVAGHYLACATVTYHTSLANTVKFVLSIDGTITPFHQNQTPGSAVTQSGSGCVIAPMAASGTARVYIEVSGGGTVVRETNSYFSMRLLP
jgi:hypothetical protein